MWSKNVNYKCDVSVCKWKSKLFYVTDPPGNDAWDRLRSGWYGVPGGVDPRRPDHHPTAGPVGSGDGEVTQKLPASATDNTEKIKENLNEICKSR